jgi:integrase/recombinase XerD
MTSKPSIVKGYKNIYYIRYLKPDGKYTQISTETKNRNKAGNKLIEFIKKFDGNLPKVAKKVSLQSFKIQVQELFRKTNRNYKRELYFYDYLIEFFGEHRNIDTITALEIEEYKNWRRKSKKANDPAKNISPASVNKELRTLKAEFTRGMRLGILNKNPFMKVQYLKVTKIEKEYLTPIEIQHIIDNIENTTLKNIVVFAVLTGCRLNEIVFLQWANIDLQNRIICIKNTIDENKNIIFRTKTNENREIPINDSLLTMLVGFNRLGGFVFCKDNGHKFEKDYISKAFKKVLRALGYSESLHFHSLRHSFITNLIKNNVNIYFVKELAGHKNIQTTLKYIHTNTDDLMSSINTLNVNI